MKGLLKKNRSITIQSAVLDECKHCKLFDFRQNKDGKACLLKALCEVNQKPKGRVGTFVEEILKAIFT